MELLIFNVNQKNVPRCVQAHETGLKVRTPPPYVKKGVLAILRQTSMGDNPKNYGVVEVYRIAEIEKHDPTLPIQGWEPSLGWNNIVKLKELLVLPSIFKEDFSLPTQVLRHKESKFVKGLLNKDMQGDSREINEPAATNYIKAIEERYPQLEKSLESKAILQPAFPDLLYLLRHKKQVILYGPPGTGKTYQASKVAVDFLSFNNKLET